MFLDRVVLSISQLLKYFQKDKKYKILIVCTHWENCFKRYMLYVDSIQFQTEVRIVVRLRRLTFLLCFKKVSLNAHYQTGYIIFIRKYGSIHISRNRSRIQAASNNITDL